MSQLCVEVTSIQWVETRAAAECPPVHPHKAPGLKVHEPRGCRTLGWVVSEETSNCTILQFSCWELCLPDHWLETVTTHSCSPSRPPLHSSCTAGEGLPLPRHCQDSDQASCPAQPLRRQLRPEGQKPITITGATDMTKGEDPPASLCLSDPALPAVLAQRGELVHPSPVTDAETRVQGKDGICLRSHGEKVELEQRAPGFSAESRAQ